MAPGNGRSQCAGCHSTDSGDGRHWAGQVSGLQTVQRLRLAVAGCAPVCTEECPLKGGPCRCATPMGVQLQCVQGVPWKLQKCMQAAAVVILGGGRHRLSREHKVFDKGAGCPAHGGCLAAGQPWCSAGFSLMNVRHHENGSTPMMPRVHPSSWTQGVLQQDLIVMYHCMLSLT